MAVTDGTYPSGYLEGPPGPPGPPGQNGKKVKPLIFKNILKFHLIQRNALCENQMVLTAA